MFRSPLTDAILVIVVLLLIVGPKKLPQLGRGLGDGMREFKEGITNEHKDDQSKQPLNEAHAAPTATTPEREVQPAPPARDAGSDRS